MTNKPAPAWAIEAAASIEGCGSTHDQEAICCAETTFAIAHLLVATREAALREAADQAGTAEDRNDILALIVCEPGTHRCATCGAERTWTVGEGHRHVHAESCTHYVAPPPPPPEIPWVRIT